MPKGLPHLLDKLLIVCQDLITDQGTTPSSFHNRQVNPLNRDKGKISQKNRSEELRSFSSNIAKV